ncbi:hypothetical protein J6590_020224 [Homalodisca vitripennis]|nr:hypothetical protein J6590_020224 [Homalodisca vitripennis]
MHSGFYTERKYDHQHLLRPSVKNQLIGKRGFIAVRLNLNANLDFFVHERPQQAAWWGWGWKNTDSIRCGSRDK